MVQQTFTTSSISQDIRTLALDDFNSAFVTFKNPDGGTAFPNTVSGTPVISVQSELHDPGDPGGYVVRNAAMETYASGLFRYTLNPTDLDTGTYDVTFNAELQEGSFQNSVDLPATLQVRGQFRVLTPNAQAFTVYRIRHRLKDVNVKLYQLNLRVQQWSDEEILLSAEKALDKINLTGPRLTNFNLRTVTNVAFHFVVDLAFADLLESMSVLENFNTATMSDGGANLSWNRVGPFQSLGSSIHNRVRQDLMSWKKAHVPNMRGQGSTQYPFRFRNLISWFPNQNNVF